MIITGMSSFKRFYTQHDFIGYGIIHANNIELVQRLQSIHNKVYYVPNGVDTSYFKRNTRMPNKMVVGAVGSSTLAEHKGKSAIARICEECDVEYMPLYIDPQNALQRSEMLKYYNSLNLFIVNSKSETGPNTAMEAMSCGIPVISNDVGLMSEIIKNGHNGYIVDGSDESYISVIEKLKKQHDGMRKMGKNAEETISKYDWSIQALNYKKMFEDFLCSK